MNLEIQIEELRAELRNAVDPEERRQIKEELEQHIAERDAIIARQEAEIESVPPE